MIYEKNGDYKRIGEGGTGPNTGGMGAISDAIARSATASGAVIRTEAPRGEYGIYMVSKGGNRPHRLKIRSACFTNLQALKDMSVGNYVADAVLILGSLDIVLGETDR